MKSRLFTHLATLLPIAFGSVAVLVAQTASPQKGQPPASATEGAYRAAAESAERKFRRIEENGAKARPDQTPTVITEQEINSYLQSDQVRLPEGVNRLRFSGSQGKISTTAQVDFDKITAESRSNNPLMSLFSGVHEVQVSATGEGVGGQGRVHIESVSIDGVGVPRIALEYFVDQYIKPKHPELGLDSTFRLPARIDTARIGDHNVTITQK